VILSAGNETKGESGKMKNGTGPTMIMTRRKLLQTAVAAGVWHVFRNAGFAGQASSVKDIENMQKNWRALLAKDFKAPVPSEPLKLSKDEWRKRLDSAQFQILREEGTEGPGTSALNGEKRPGVFICAGCSLPLFTSAMKYESGTGWPSFFTTIAGVFGTRTDYKLILPRTEYHCIRCGGHHGHLFSDGPKPTGQRWCNNGVALKFIPQSGSV
jgi:peptide-methionine (R)-S-oxide reductase